MSADRSNAGFIVGHVPPSWLVNTQAIELTWPIVLHNWIEPRCTIASILGNNLTLAAPCGQFLINRSPVHPEPPTPVTAEAVANFPLTPGTFYHDVAKNAIIYTLGPGQTEADLQNATWVSGAEVRECAHRRTPVESVACVSHVTPTPHHHTPPTRLRTVGSPAIVCVWCGVMHNGALPSPSSHRPPPPILVPLPHSYLAVPPPLPRPRWCGEQSAGRALPVRSGRSHMAGRCVRVLHVVPAEYRRRVCGPTIHRVHVL